MGGSGGTAMLHSIGGLLRLFKDSWTARLGILALACWGSVSLSAGAALACAGDCGQDGEVTVNDLVLMVNVALGADSVDRCHPGDTDGDGTISITEIIGAVNNALNGCTAGPTPTATATPGGSTTYVGDYFG